MKILYLSSDLGIPVLGRKGAAVHLREMISAFSQLGHEVVLVAPVLHKSPWERPAHIQAFVHHFPLNSEIKKAIQVLNDYNQSLGLANSLASEIRRILYNQSLGLELMRSFEKDPPDFIYERASIYSTVGVQLASRLKRPLIVEVNTPLSLEQEIYRQTKFKDLINEAERFTLTKADAVVVVSDALKHYLIALGIDQNKIHVMPNGVDPALFKPGPPEPAVSAKWKLNGGPILGFSGGLRPWHGTEFLISPFEKLVQKYPKLQLLFVGDGPMRLQIVEMLKKKNLSKNVIFTGLVPHEEVPALIRQFTVALAPYPAPKHSFYFSPLKLFEYMACGKPVVAASVGQIKEVIEDGVTGMLYPAQNTDKFLEACEKLLANQKLREKIGQAASKKIHQGYTWQINAAKVTKIALKIINSQTYV